VLRTRPPRSTPEGARARLACIRHAASVDPEPGSNSPPMLRRAVLHRNEATPLRKAVPSAPRKKPHIVADVAPAGVLLLRVDGHALRSGVFAVCESKRQSRPSGSPEGRARHPLAPSSAPDKMARRSRLLLKRLQPRSSVPSASLSLCRPTRSGSLGTADAASAASPAPSGRPFHARGSLLTGACKGYPVLRHPVKGHGGTDDRQSEPDLLPILMEARSAVT
jgi:hypothetical protein